MDISSTIDLINVWQGGTGAVTALQGFNNLSPMTTQGDLIVGGVSGSALRFPIGPAGTVLSSNGSTLYWGTGGTGEVTVTGTPSVGQLAGWSGVSSIQGITVGTGLTLTGTLLTATGTGGVTNFSAGALSPLFTTSVATATSTPALSFALVSQSQNLVYASPASGSGNPAFRSLVVADLPGGAWAVASVTGTSNQITASPTTGAVVVSLPSAVTMPGSLAVTTTSILQAVTINGAATFNSTLTVSGSGAVNLGSGTTTVGGQLAVTGTGFSLVTIGGPFAGRNETTFTNTNAVGYSEMNWTTDQGARVAFIDVNGGAASNGTIQLGALLAGAGIQYYASGSSIGYMTSTGLNGMAIGQTTPAAGSFTTLSATTSITLSNASNPLLSVSDTTATTGPAVFLQAAHTIGSGEGLVGTTSNHPLGVYVSAVKVATFSSTGLSVIGTSTLTGNVTFGGSLLSAGSLVLGTNGSTTALTLDTSQNATFAGNVGIAGTLSVTGTSTLNGTTTIGNGTATGLLYVNGGAVGSYAAYIGFEAAGTNYWAIGRGPADASANFQIYDLEGTPGVRLSLASGTGAFYIQGTSTLTGNVTVGSGSGNALTYINGGAASTTALIFDQAGTEVGRVSFGATQNMTLCTGANVTALTLDTSQSATFAGNVGIAGTLGVTGTSTLTGNVTVQSTAGIKFTGNVSMTGAINANLSSNGRELALNFSNSSSGASATTECLFGNNTQALIFFVLGTGNSTNPLSGGPATAGATGIYTYGNSPFTLGTNSIAALTLDTSQGAKFAGHVGIGAVTSTSPLHISGLPTSSSGLATGDIWNNGGVLTVK